MKTTTEEILNGVNIITIPATQYKTNLISLYIKRPLSKSEATMNSLIPYVLRAGSRNLPTQSAIVKELQALYGSSIGVNVSKVGEKQILSFKLAYTDEKYLDEKIAERVIAILLEMVFEPYIENGAFKPSIVKIEKEILGEAILAKMNNKGSYAMEQMVQAMCQDEPFSISEDGYTQDLEQIDEKNLYVHYQKVIAESEIDFSLAGNVDKETVARMIREKITALRGDVHKLSREEIYKEPSEVREVIEKISVVQGKIALGYRTNIAVEDDLYIPMMVYNVILGGGVSSKLFMNVREKHSLSYSIGSGMEPLKSLLFIRAGIEVTDFERAKKLIFAEVDDMKNGKISETELAHAKLYLVNGIRSVSDSIWGISDYIYSLKLQGADRTPESVMEQVMNVTIEQVVSAAQKIKLDTIYFLTNDEVTDEQ